MIQKIFYTCCSYAKWNLNPPVPGYFSKKKKIEVQIETTVICILLTIIIVIILIIIIIEFQVRDGGTPESALIGRYCSRNIPLPVVSQNNQLFVRFRSDYSVSSGGFRATYETSKNHLKAWNKQYDI